jgi:hypothetical protein
MTPRRTALALLVTALLAAHAVVAAQPGHRRTPPPPPPSAIPMSGTLIDWSVFVSAFGDASSSRTTVPGTASPLTLPAAAGWTCTVGVPTRAAVDTDHWSEVRTLECRRGDATVSTTGFCQIASSSWGARAAVLSLGSPGVDERLQVTLDCTVRN